MLHQTSLISVIFLASSLITSSAFSQSKLVVAANNQFALDFYRIVADQPGNLVFSPLSIEVALAMTSAGAKAETFSQMRKVLHLPESYHADFKELLSQIKGNKDFQLYLANRIWGQSGNEYDPTFLNILKTNYESDLKPLDFRTESEPARIEINNWVASQTQDKIKDLIGKGLIAADTEMVLTNAIYFKGEWVNPFKKEATKTLKFTTSKDSVLSVPTMHQKKHFSYFENPDAQILEMPYKGGELVMDFFLPPIGIHLDALESKLTPALIDNLLSKMTSFEVSVSLPKFKIEKPFGLNQSLSTLGMPLAFDQKKADFSGIRKLKTGDNIFISSVVHKAFINVDEKGTEAAAATGVTMSLLGAMLNRNLKVFNADRPFLYMIRQQKTGAILFMGRLENP